MASVIGGEAAFIGSLTELIELNWSAVDALRAALARMSRPGDKSRLASFLKDHERHLEELSAIAHELGDPPAESAVRPRLKSRALTNGIVGDRAILEAMRYCEEDSCAAYERMIASRDGLSDRARDVLRQSLAVERRHREWFSEQLDSRQGLLLLPL
ncbi:ferritin-like domain-containing protein [Sorangium sp. So ce136]|uniref:ferritin-like domain-containing protein n=1 Tax=Sorangium sp. So ce136 TaxID=3133284 RepID=UPI003F075B8F